MKNTGTILILGIMLFNIAGYRFIYSFLEKKATLVLENKIETGSYSDDQLVEIQIPLNMPYYSDKDFEPAYGETDWDGIHYRYVKRKISGNTLYLLCIPNKEKNKIIFAKNDFIQKNISDNQKNNVPVKQPSPVFKTFLSDYISGDSRIQLSRLFHQPVKYPSFRSELISQFDPLTPFQPPEDCIS